MFSSLIDQALHDGAAATRVAARSEFALARLAPEPGNYDEQFVLADDSDRPLGNVRYRVVADTGRPFQAPLTVLDERAASTLTQQRS
ncbi:hypothetical protein [Burkholderia pyrrocinia]|uniref:Uncharacterized protein n=1 Tax=Burkholderia pyrrocinia TaxID=60550 RepID=A0ABZ3BQP2_BURPY